jgi:putative peptidoglycan lipid II flippase
MSEEAKQERRALTSRAGIVASGTLLSRLLGLVREQVFAALFTRVATDVFFVAFLIPNVLRQLLAEGATQNGVLPVLTQIRERQGEQQARAFYAALRGLFLLVLGAVCAVGILGAPWWVQLFAGGFQSTPQKFERAVLATRWVFPYIFFMGNAALGVAALNAHRRFVVTSFAPGLLNVSFILSALLLPHWFETHHLDPLLALAVGVLAGGLLQVVAQWPSLRAIGYLTLPRLRLADPGVKEVLRRMAPVLFGFGVYYVDVVVARHLLSDMGDGALSYFAFAQRLCDFPQGIFVMAVQTATLPSLATLAAKGDNKELLETLRHGLRLVLFAAIPATLLFTVLAQPLVRLIFERGEFDASATLQTAQALLAQGLGIWMVAVVRQLLVTFYAVGDTRSPVLVSAVDFLAFLALALWLRDDLGHLGISWAVTGASAVQMLLLLWLLRRRVGVLGLGKLLPGTAKVAAAAGFAGTASWWLTSSLDATWGLYLPGALGAVGFAVVFLMACWMAGCQELGWILKPLVHRFRRERDSSSAS